MARSRRLDLQAKITLVLLAVILPIFLVVTVIENQITEPLLEEEMKQIGITSGKTLASEIATQRLLMLPEPARNQRIEAALQEILYYQPNIVRMDVIIRDPATGVPRVIGSNFEVEPGATPPVGPSGLVDIVTSEYRIDDETKDGVWDIQVPIETRGRDPRGPRRFLGTVHVVVSMKFVTRIVETLWKITASGAAVSVVLLLLALSYFLRKTIRNDRLLRRAETENLQLTEQLRDAERQLMNTEKLAVMGQLTASFAHEIGTPLNAVGGHLQLLGEELGDAAKEGGDPARAARFGERLEIINGQLAKIEGIVKGFLQSTAKPASQRQLVDPNRIVEQTLAIVRPRLESLGIEVGRDLDRAMGPLRVVPLDLEQILLNLVNNSIDSLKAKARVQPQARLVVGIDTRSESEEGKSWAVITVHDTGEGIRKADLGNVLKPFYTTKSPGEGTGLGLAICQDLARKYGGVLKLDSKEGAWTRAVVRIPYQ